MTLWQPDGLRVIELGGGISAPFGARLLADFGADVIKIERPGLGDDSRSAGPFPDDVPDLERSGLFLYLNFGKRSMTLDVATASGAALLARLLQDADVLIENLGAGEFNKLPLPEGTINDRLIVCSISPYGQDGPKSHYRGSELSAYASGGMMYITGEAEREPLKQALSQAAHHSGVNAASAVLAASFLQRRAGRGQRIDISEQETMAMTIFPALSTYAYTGGVMRRGRGTVPRLVSSMPMPTKDGWIMPSYAGLGTWWEAFAGFMGLPEFAGESFSTARQRREHAELIDAKFGEEFKKRPTRELFHQGQEWGLTLTALQSVGDVAGCEHLTDRGFFFEQDHPIAGRVKMPGMVPLTPYLDRTPARRAPLLGEHNAEIYSDLGLSRDDVTTLAGAGII